jgi:outer membrane protein
MKKICIAVLILSWAVAGGPLVAAQETSGALTLTLEECIEMALEQNPFHLGTKEKESQARALVREAAAGFFPSLNAQGMDTLDEKLFVLEFPSFVPGEPPQRIKVDFTRDYQFSFSLSLPLYTGGRMTSGYRQANYNLLATRETIRLSRHETVFQVKQAFYGYLLAREFVKVAEESLSLAEGFLKNVRNLYDVGMASKLDLLQAEVRLANLKPQAIRAKNSLDVSLLGLKTAVGIDLDTPVRIEGELAFAPLEADAENSVAEALARRPEILGLDYQSRMAGEMLRMARADHLPTLAIGGAYNLWADRFNFNRGTWQNYYSINLVLNFPLFNGLKTQARIAQSKAALRELEWNRKGLTETVKFEVRQAVLNYEQARETLVSLEKNVEQALEAVRIAELNYAEGLATNLDVMTTQLALTQARVNYSQALYDCVISLAQLEKAVGRERAEGDER